MKNLIFLILSTVCFIQVCHSTTVGDAENKLKTLRDLTNREIENAFHQHNKMSEDVDQIALYTKQRGAEEIGKKTDKFQAKLKADRALTYRCRGSRDHVYNLLKNQYSDELIRCVDQQGSESVNTLSTQRLALVEYVWNAIYEEEKHIIACGKDSKCLDSAIADIEDKIYEVGQVIKEEIVIAKHGKEAQLQAIKGCGSASVANAEHALGNVPTCSY